MNFGKVIKALKQGKKVTRDGWNENTFLYLDENKSIVLKTTNGMIENWSPTNDDMLSNVWHIVGECENQQHTEQPFEKCRMGEEIDSILSSIAKWAEGDKEKRSFILICSDTDLKKDEKGHNSQCVFAMQGKEELNEFSLFQIFNNNNAAVFKEMVKRALTLSIIKKFTSK